MLQSQFRYLRATDSHELMQAMDIKERTAKAEAVVHHLKARKETRWAGWQTRSDYPERDDAHFDCFIESRRTRRRAKCPRLPARMSRSSPAIAIPLDVTEKNEAEVYHAT